ncbi:MAG: type II toxin-antitoxin system RelE/ParE family toxin [Bacteroidota bacterium]
MVKVTWTRRAVEDIYEIREHYLVYSPRLAEEITNQIFEKESFLSQYPKMGRVVPEFRDKNLREIIFRNYRIIYQLPTPDTLNILSIHPGQRPLSKRSFLK